jgi:hypothetical protein
VTLLEMLYYKVNMLPFDAATIPTVKCDRSDSNQWNALFASCDPVLVGTTAYANIYVRELYNRIHMYIYVYVYLFMFA